MEPIAHTTPQTFRLHWISYHGRVQYRYFTTLRQMRGYMRSQCQGFNAILTMSVFQGSKYQAFILVSNKIVTESELRSHLALFEQRRVD